MFELFVQGGWVMYPLLVFSVLALAVILERGLYFFMSRQRLDRFLEAMDCKKREGHGGDRAALQEKLAAQNRRGYLTRMAWAYLDCTGEGAAAVSEELFAAGSGIIQENGKRLSMLASIAHLAPLLGLFGTVLGMIEVFRRLESIGGRADVSLLSGGIWVALLTTAFGLLVAIPTLIAHHYFSSLVTGRAEDLQLLVSRLNVYTGAAVSMSIAGEKDSGNPYEAISAT
ncbi:MAG: MotA/TolQ/ExbB proton channel family protein [Treponema sp.]|jgi:biopolymer transport protein ExbB|nr:MotA/TolQ/ExbB proton channel family protein [Treponema sp.]